MLAQAYLDLKKRHEKEISDFPIAYAFSDEQLKTALEKLGATKSECVSVFGHGDVMKKEDAPKFIVLLKRHNKEVIDFLNGDKTEAYEAFLYEMDNHEYAINWDGDGDVLGCFSLEWEDLEKMGLRDSYILAKRAHMKHAQEWGMI